MFTLHAAVNAPSAQPGLRDLYFDPLVWEKQVAPRLSGSCCSPLAVSTHGAPPKHLNGGLHYVAAFASANGTKCMPPPMPQAKQLGLGLFGLLGSHLRVIIKIKRCSATDKAVPESTVSGHSRARNESPARRCFNRQERK